MKIAIVGPRLAAATTLALLFASTGLAASPPSPPTPAAAEDKLQSEFLFDLALEAQMPNNLATANGGRLIVPISGGTFAGPRLKGTIVLPSGDWVVQRPDGSRILDVRILLQTDDDKRFTCHGAESPMPHRVARSGRALCRCSKRPRKKMPG